MISEFNLILKHCMLCNVLYYLFYCRQISQLLSSNSQRIYLRLLMETNHIAIKLLSNTIILLMLLL